MSCVAVTKTETSFRHIQIVQFLQKLQGVKSFLQACFKQKLLQKTFRKKRFCLHSTFAPLYIFSILWHTNSSGDDITQACFVHRDYKTRDNNMKKKKQIWSDCSDNDHTVRDWSHIQFIWDHMQSASIVLQWYIYLHLDTLMWITAPFILDDPNGNWAKVLEQVFSK